jgi:hypothetical protein
VKGAVTKLDTDSSQLLIYESFHFSSNNVITRNVECGLWVYIFCDRLLVFRYNFLFLCLCHMY